MVETIRRTHTEMEVINNTIGNFPSKEEVIKNFLNRIPKEEVVE